MPRLRPHQPIFEMDVIRGSIQVGNTPATPSVTPLVIADARSATTIDNLVLAAEGPVFVGIGTRTAANVVPVPAGLTAGDLMLVCLHGSTSMNPTNPGGWTQLYNQNSPGGYSRDLAAFIKFAAGGETTFNFATTGEGQMYTFRDVDATTPLDVSIVDGGAYSGAGFTAPSITTATANALLFAYDESRIFDVSWDLTTPNGYGIAVKDLVQACVRVAPTVGTYVGWHTADTGDVQRGITIAFRAA